MNEIWQLGRDQLASAVNDSTSVALRNFRPSSSTYTNGIALGSDKSQQDKLMNF